MISPWRGRGSALAGCAFAKSVEAFRSFVNTFIDKVRKRRYRISMQEQQRGRRDERFFASTRGRVVLLLRKARQTVEDLASALRRTDNAVRTHLAGLEHDGLVRRAGIRRGLGKPALVYELSPVAETLFPRPYGDVLRELFGVLAERFDPETV